MKNTDFMLSGVVLAGGKSLRMGKDKGFVKWHGVPLVTHQLSLLKEIGCHELFISGRRNVQYPFQGRILNDPIENGGPLAGIAAALDAATGTHLLVLAVDVPCVTVAFLSRLIAETGPGYGSVPIHEKGLEPLIAIYPKKLAKLAGQWISQKLLTTHEFVRQAIAEGSMFPMAMRNEDLSCLTNINDSQDLGLSVARDFFL